MNNEYTGEQNLTMIAYEKLRDAIIENRIQSGYCISGNKLAKQLNMSRTPVREAIQLLEKDGLIEIQKGIGFFVRQLTIPELKEITQVRKLLECEALRLSAPQLTKTMLEEQMRAWVEIGEDSSDSTQEKLRKSRIQDTQTHHFLTRYCNNGYLLEILKSIQMRSIRIQHLSIEALNVDGAIMQHVEILEALRDDALDLAIALLAQHIDFSVEYIQTHSYLIEHGNGSYLSPQQLQQIF